MPDASEKRGEGGSFELLPPEGDDGVGYKVFEILDEVLKDKEALRLPEKWNNNYKLLKGQHWKTKRTKSNTAMLVANVIFTHRQRTVSMLTDNDPTFNVVRVGEDLEEEDGQEGFSGRLAPGQSKGPATLETEPMDTVRALLKTAEFWWQDQEQQDVFSDSVNIGEMDGCVVEKVIFNSEMESGLGEVETLTVSPFYFGVYPVSCMKVQKAEALLHFYPMSVREARRKWPKLAEEIVGDNEYLNEIKDQTREISGANRGAPGGWKSTIGNVIKNFINTAELESGEPDETLVVECWALDYTRNKDGEYKYDGNIRCVTVLNGGKLVVSDRSNPSINPTMDREQARKTYLWDKRPFSLSVSVKDPVTPWGMSDFEQLQQLQVAINTTLTQINMVKDKAARLKLINPKDSGVTNQELTNEPGILNPTTAMTGAGIHYMEPPPINADLLNILNIFKEVFFLVSGTFDLEQAQTPGREVVAYKAIAALLERAATTQREKLRSYGKMIRERGRMFLSHVMNWYTEDRFVSYTDEGGLERQIKIRGNKMIVPAKLTVISGSTMPVSKIQQREEALGLYERGAIDSEELLKKMDWSDWRQVVNRMKKGPMGMFLDKLSNLGAPQPLLSWFASIFMMQEKDFERKVEKGEVPQFIQVMQEVLGQTPQGPSPQEQIAAGEHQATMMKTQAEAQLRQAQAQKEMAEIDFIREQTFTERVKQQVAAAGMKFDEEKLNIERAKMVKEMDAADRQGIVDSHQRKEDQYDKDLSRAKSEMDLVSAAKERGNPDFQERGMASDNADVLT